MQYSTIFRILGVLLMLFSISMLPPIFIANMYHDGGVLAFSYGFFLTAITGFLMWFRFRHDRNQLRTRDGFIIVVLFWTVLSLFGAVPLLIADHVHNSFTNSLFESVSGLTTTGASVLTGIDYLPHAIRFYRQELHFLGGMGLVVLAVAVLPMLGVGGMQLYRVETPGPMKDSKLTPRITETAKALWLIYVGLNVVCAVAYHLAGMSWFEAIGESFSTIATGGFSMHDISFAYYHSIPIDLVAVIFMILGGVNFTLHFVAFKRRSLRYYWRDIEFRVYMYIILLIFLICFTVIWLDGHFQQVSTAVVDTLFTVVSFATTTGLETTNYHPWPAMVAGLLMFVALIGACGGSTTGGIKLMRFILLAKQSMRELRRLVHPKAVYPLKYGRHTLPDSTVEAIWGFVAIYLALFVVSSLLLLLSGLDFKTALSASVAGLANAGAGFGGVAETFAHLSTFSKWVIIFDMLAGRLEVFTLLVLFTAMFWKD